MFILIVLYDGGVEIVKVCVDEEHARAELADWCIDNWHDEDACYEDFSTDGLIEWYFDNYEDYSYYSRGHALPGQEVPPAEDILLTPGMCAIVREGLARMSFGDARSLLQYHDEIENNGIETGQQAQLAINEIREQFE